MNSRDMLARYLAGIGMSRPADAAQQIQVTLLQQWTDHLSQVLEDEGVPPVQALRIIRSVIYGGAPHRYEAEFREEITREMVTMRENWTVPDLGIPGP